MITLETYMVEVFKTDVQETPEADRLINLLLYYFPGSRINIDLDDCDKVLRIEGDNISAGQVIKLVHEHGYSCNVLD